MTNPEPQLNVTLQSVRGMNDFLPRESERLVRLETIARDIFKRYGYGEIRTPLVESLSLFERALGQTTDIVEKEMFVLQDRGDRNLCLRPEGTASVVRALVEHHLEQKMPQVKLFYTGPMFRAERPQAGRYRQFNQIGTEYFGNASAASDAETIAMVYELLSAFGIPSVEIQLNSLGCKECRVPYQTKLKEYLSSKAAHLCKDCQRRMQQNPLRALDCKVDQENLKDAPRSIDCLCASCLAHHEEVVAFLKAAQVPFVFQPTLVRGLDYYSRTVFEAYATGKSGSQDALAAGGRYDSLVEELGGSATPAVGFALGAERVLNILSQNEAVTDAVAKSSGIFVAALGAAAARRCFEILCNLRKNGFVAEGVLNNQSLKSQMRLADSLGMRYCLILGDNEIAENVIALRDLENKTQEKIPLDGIIQHFKR